MDKTRKWIIMGMDTKAVYTSRLGLQPSSLPVCEGRGCPGRSRTTQHSGDHGKDPRDAAPESEVVVRCG